MTVKLRSFYNANLETFCIKGALNPNAGFDTKKMRKHLQSVLQSGILSCFPTVLRQPNIRNRNRTKRESIPINLHCKCRLPDCVRELVKCASCKMCFHKYRVRVCIDLSCPTNTFVCEKCLEWSWHIKDTSFMKTQLFCFSYIVIFVDMYIYLYIIYSLIIWSVVLFNELNSILYFCN